MPSVTEPRRIALFIPSLCYGGAERQVVEIARHMDREQFEVHIVTLIDYSPLLSETDELHDRLHILGRASFLDPRLIPRLCRIVRDHRIELVHAFLFLPEVVARVSSLFLRDVAILGSERNTDYTLASYRWFCLRATAPLCQRVVANSRAGAEYNQAYFSQSPDKYRVLYNGVDTARFKPRDRDAAKQALGLNTESVVIGMFASFKRQKNHVFLFEALSQVASEGQEITLLLVGDTLVADHEDTQTYKQEVNQTLAASGLEPRTVVLGNRTDVETVYPACDFTVLPSRHEGTPNVVLESMACGVPAVVTDVSDNATLVTDGEDGLVVPLDDTPALRDALSAMITSSAHRETLGQAARATAEARFSLTAMVGNVAAIYDELL